MVNVELFFLVVFPVRGSLNQRMCHLCTWQADRTVVVSSQGMLQRGKEVRVGDLGVVGSI